MDQIVINGTGTTTSETMPTIPGNRYVFAFASPGGAFGVQVVVTPQEIEDNLPVTLQPTPGTNLAFTIEAAAQCTGRVEFTAGLTGFRFVITTDASQAGAIISYSLRPAR